MAKYVGNNKSSLYNPDLKKSVRPGAGIRDKRLNRFESQDNLHQTEAQGGWNSLLGLTNLKQESSQLVLSV